MLAKKVEATRIALVQGEEMLSRQEAAFRAAAEKYSEAEKYVDRLKIELSALEEADRLRPAGSRIGQHQPSTVEPEGETKRRGGRKPGSISRKWRQALSDIVAAGNQPLDQHSFYLLTRARLGLAETSIRERLRQYATSGFLIETGGRFKVSDFAIQRWNLGEKTAPVSNAADDEESYPPAIDAPHNEKASH